MGVIDRKNRKKALEDRIKKSQESNDESLFGRSIFRDDFAGHKWKVKEGDRFINIIPYLAGLNDLITPEGVETYVFEFYHHQNVGVKEDTFVCLARTFNLPCPICEDIKRLKNEEVDDKIWKSMLPKRRVMYNIVCLDSEEEFNKGVQVWEAAHWNTEKHFSKRAAAVVMPGRVGVQPCTDFADPDVGRVVTFTRQGTGATNTNYYGHGLLPRDDGKGGVYTIPNEILQAAYTLDELIYKPTYDEVYTAHFGHASKYPEANNNLEKVAPWENKPITSKEETPDLSPGLSPDDSADDRNYRVGVEADTDDPCPVSQTQGGKYGRDANQFETCETDCGLWRDCYKLKINAEAKAEAQVDMSSIKKEDSTEGFVPPVNKENDEGRRRG